MNGSHRFRFAWIPLLLLLVTSCDDGSSILFPPPSLLEATLMAEGPTEGQAGQLLPSPVRVEVQDEYGNPIPNVEVTASVAGGGGSIQSTTYTTNDSGHFFLSSWRMGQRPGANALSFEAEGVDPVLVEVASGPGPPARLRVLGDDPDGAQVTSTLTGLPRIELTDEFENPIPGRTINFSATQGGTPAQNQATTDSAGQVQTPDWTLGARAGNQILTARLGGQLTAVLRADARPGPLHEAVWLSEPGIQAEAGLLLPLEPTVRVQDEWENGLEGVTVQFRVVEGQGSISATEVVSDQNGLARLERWTLGATPGVNRIEASVSGVTAVSLEAEGMDASWEPVGRYFTVHTAHINQATQRMDAGVRLIEGRPGLLRVFVEATESNAPPPPAELIVYDNGVEILRERVQPTVGSVPTTLAPDGSSLTWNLELDGDLVRPGIGVRVEIDPDGDVGVVTRRFSSFPSDGSIYEFDHFVDLPLLHVRFMAMRDGETGNTADLTEQNLDEFMDFTRRAMPVGRDSSYIGGTFTTNLYNNQGQVHTAALGALLSHFISTRDSIGDHYLHGIFPGDGPLIFAGVAYLPPSINNTTRQVGMTYDRLPQASATVAHELGHNLSLPHAPCGNPSGVDTNYPYANAQLGHAGYDRGAEQPIQSPVAMRDLMSYCGPRWISDYNYEIVLDWRDRKPVFDPASYATMSRGADSRILVSGTVSSSGAELHPVISTSATPSPPESSGPYRLVGLTADGQELFNYGFSPARVTHAPDETEHHFAYVLPISTIDHERLHEIEVRAPEAGFRGDVQRRTGAPLDPVSAQRSRVDELPEGLESAEALVRRTAAAGAPGERLEWNSEIFPTVTVWDRDTGEMVGLLRGGTLRLDLWEGQNVRFQFSDGLRSFELEEGRLEPLR